MIGPAPRRRINRCIIATYITSVLLENLPLFQLIRNYIPVPEWCIIHILKSEDIFDIPSRFFHVCLCKPSVFYAIKRTLHYDLKIYEFYALNHSKIKFIYSRRLAISFNNGYPVSIVPYFYSARDAGCIGTVA